MTFIDVPHPEAAALPHPEQSALDVTRPNAIRSLQSGVMNRRHAIGALAGGAALLAIGGLDPKPATAVARTARPDGILRDLDNDADAWKIWADPGNLLDGSLLYDPPMTIPSPGTPGNLAGDALRLAITGENRPYTHLHGYRTLQQEPHVAAVEISMRWWLSETTWNNHGEPSRIQAIEPEINKWGFDLRYEWALQWQNVSDGS